MSNPFLQRNEKGEKGYVVHGIYPKNERGYLTSATFPEIP
jgi:ribonuclease I